jgi:hypothetical protein
MDRPDEIKFARSIKRSEFRILSTEFGNRMDQINSIRIKNQELIDREVLNFRESISGKLHLFERQLTESNEITDMLELMGHDTFIRLQYPNLIRQTLLTSIFSNLEMFSKRLIKLTEDKSESKIKFKDLSSSGGDLEQVNKYFKLVQNINFEKVNNQWAILQDLKALRNFIAHQSGNIKAFEEQKGEKQCKRLEKLIFRRNMEIREDQLFISHDNEFLQFSMRASKQYFEHIATSLEKITKNPTIQISSERLEDGTIKTTKTEI